MKIFVISMTPLSITADFSEPPQFQHVVMVSPLWWGGGGIYVFLDNASCCNCDLLRFLMYISGFILKRSMVVYSVLCLLKIVKGPIHTLLCLRFNIARLIAVL